MFTNIFHIVKAPNMTIHPIIKGTIASLICAFSSTEPIINFIPKIEDTITAITVLIAIKIFVIVFYLSFILT